MVPGFSIAHYRITAKLGEGGMGEVYRATDTKLGREVAIKVIPDVFAQDEDRMARFTREAQMLAALNHPNIAAIYGVEDRALVMELVEGSTLAARIAAGPMPLAEVLPVALQIVDALECAHEKGIVHRDLKPANIKITPEGRVKVLDFGLAKALANETAQGDPASSPTLTMRATMAGVILGTAGYMSPEQARGHEADKRADIWSFGVVLYEMLTGRQIFVGPTVSDTLAAVLMREPDWSLLPPDTPPALHRLLRRCLERERRQRLPDIAVARMELDDALRGGPAESPVAAASPKADGWLRWWSGAATVVALAALAVAAMHFRETPAPPDPLRFQIPAPEKTQFGTTGLAVSPDGRRIAFIAAGAHGAAMIWVRSLDSLAAQALPGTEGVVYLPFWSPDGRSIGFMAQGKLRKVEASGGPPQIICDQPGISLAGSWSREGVIIFSTSNGGLFRVPQAGGVPSRITTPNESQGEIGHLRPWFLPDGRHFLYVTRTRQPENAAIYLASLDSKERKRLAATQQAGAYAPPAAGSRTGHLLFLRQNTLMAQPLDGTRFEPVGEAFPVAEQVGSYLAMGLFSVSTNGVLAYRSGDSAGGSQLVWFDRTGKSLGTLGAHNIFNGGLSISPDGKRVAVDQMDQTGNRDVWVLDVARGVPMRFTFDSAQEVGPVWAPDGRRLLFSSDRAGGINSIYKKDSSGSGNEELLFKSGIPMLAYDWSPDGRYLLYGALDPKTRSDLWVLPVAAGTAGEGKPAPYVQTPFSENQGQFSPNGRWIAYTSDESGQPEIYVQSFPAGGGKYQVSTGAGGTQARWRRDGKEMFYIGGDGNLMAVNVKTEGAFEADTPRGLFNPRIFFGATNAYFRYDVAKDGQRFLAISVDTGAEGSGPAPITVVVNWQAALKR